MISALVKKLRADRAFRLALVALTLAASPGCMRPTTKHPVGANLDAARLNEKGEAAFKSRDYKSAVKFFEEALRVDYSVDDIAGAAVELVDLAETSRRLGDSERAAASAEEALRLAEAESRLNPYAAKDVRLYEAASRGAMIRAAMFYDDEKFDEAAQWAEKAMRLCDSVGCARRGKILNAAGRIALAQGKADAALDFAERGKEAAGDELEKTDALRLAAEIYEARGALDRALALLKEALTLDKSAGDPRRVGDDLAALGKASLKSGDVEKGLIYIEKAQRSYRSAGDAESAEALARR